MAELTLLERLYWWILEKLGWVTVETIHGNSITIPLDKEDL